MIDGRLLLGVETWTLHLAGIAREADGETSPKTKTPSLK